MINPAFLSAGIAALGMAANARSVRETNRTNIQLMRERNAAQAAANAAAWNREVAYNNPSAQVSRMRSAGLNPNLLYQSAPMNTVNMVAPDVQAANAQAVQYDTSGVVGSLNASAAIENIRANTNKTIAETEGVNLDNWLKQATNGDRKRLAGLEVELMDSEILKNDTERQNIAARTGQIYSEISVANETIKSMKFDRAMQFRNYLLHSKEIDAACAKIASEVDLNKRQVKEMMLTFVDRARGIHLNNELTSWSAFNMEQISGNNALLLRLNGQYSELERRLGHCQTFFNTLSGAAQTFSSKAAPNYNFNF